MENSASKTRAAMSAVLIIGSVLVIAFATYNSFTGGKWSSGIAVGFMLLAVGVLLYTQRNKQKN